MRISQDEKQEIPLDTESKPRFRNVNAGGEASVPEEPSDGPDKRLVAAAAILLVLILFVGLRGSFANKSLSAKVKGQEEAFNKAQAEALLYGITIDEDDEVVLPETEPTDVTELDWDSVEARNKEILDSFTKVLLNWQGQKGYNEVRQTLMDDWSFAKDSDLLRRFMPESDKIDTNISLSGYTPFVLSDDAEGMSYFLICSVRTTIDTGKDDKSETGSIGVQITINKEGTISNVSAQPLH